MEEKQLTRKEYIESELNKWKEHYEVRFQDEFDLKAMLDLQYQFAITPKDHIKTLGDIIHTKNQIMKNLNLKPKTRKGNGETWIVNLTYKEIDTKTYKLELIKINESNGKVKIINNLNKHQYKHLRELAEIVLINVLDKRPDKILFDRMGIGLGIYEAVLELIKINKNLDIREDGTLIYYNN